MQVNDIYKTSFIITQEQVELFAKSSGDTNPIHLDEEYAKKTIFKRRIVHGFLGGSIFSKVFGTVFPGEGTIYLKQSLIFKAPMFVDAEYMAVFEIKEIIQDKSRAIVKTSIFDEKSAIVIEGEALIQNSKIINI